MSKFENLLNTLWEDYNQPTPPAGTNPAAGNTSLAPSPSPTGANPTTASTTAPPGTPNSINNQQQNKSQPAQPPIDPLKHPVGQDLVNAKTTQQVADALKQKGLQLTPIVNK